MAVVTDPMSGVSAFVAACRVCRAPVYFGYTPAGKRCPFDVVDGEPTRVSHFTTCAKVREWTSAHPKREAV